MQLLAVSVLFNLKMKGGTMKHRIRFNVLSIILMPLFLVAMSGFVFADFEDFIDTANIKKQEEFCRDAFLACGRECAKKKKMKKCFTTCKKRVDKCLDAAPNNAINEERLPKEARKEWEKIAKKRDKHNNKCQKADGKAFDKCLKKHGDDDPTGTVKCYGKSGARVKMDKCFEKGQNKYPFKTKKLVKLLKGKKP